MERIALSDKEKDRLIKVYDKQRMTLFKWTLVIPCMYLLMLITQIASITHFSFRWYHILLFIVITIAFLCAAAYIIVSNDAIKIIKGNGIDYYLVNIEEIHIEKKLLFFTNVLFQITFDEKKEEVKAKDLYGEIDLDNPKIIVFKSEGKLHAVMPSQIKYKETKKSKLPPKIKEKEIEIEDDSDKE